MRTTVGPLPSAVYWRRRAVVLGALLLGVLILFISCSDNGDAQKRGAGNTQTPSASANQIDVPEEEPSFADAVPGGGPVLPDPSDVAATPVPDPAPGVSNGPNVAVEVPANGQCTDAEMSVTPVPSRTTARRGVPVEIRLKIKNVSVRTCARNVGADLQEIYLRQGVRPVWSSDKCGIARGSNVEQFTPGFEREYRATWNGRETSKCTGGMAAGPAPPIGVYQVFGRLGAKVSEPVQLNITG